MSRSVIALALLFLWLGLAASCANGTAPPPASSPDFYGRPCAIAADCTSRVCVGIGDGTGVCSAPCNAAGDCVAGWSCGPFQGQSTDVCLCTKSAEICDGLDNDCNGIVDDPRPANADCVERNHGEQGFTCQNGFCACQSRCDSACVDLKTDPLSCGKCGTACPGDAACVNGSCACPGGSAVCGSSCVDTTTDNNHCGDCQTVCPKMAVCTSSFCQCPFGQSVCGSACTDVSTDPANCGSCGATCAGTCSLGHCVITLASSLESPQLMSVEAGDVYWTDSKVGAVMKVSSSGGTPTTIVSDQANAGPLTVDSKNVYWAAAGGVLQAPISGGAPTVLGTEAAADLTIDSTYVYYVAQAGVYRVPIGGGVAATLLLSATSVSTDPTAYGSPPIFVDSKYIYWGTCYTDGGSCDNWQTALDGQGLSTDVAFGIPARPDVAITGDSLIYGGDAIWVETFGTANTFGLAALPLVVTTPTGIASDGAWVYWTYEDAMDGVILKVPLSGGESTVLARNQAMPAAIALDATSAYWINSATAGSASIVKVTPR